MALQKGDKVMVHGEPDHEHGFKTGTVVTYTGVDYPPHHKGQWRQFEDEDGFTQYLLDRHYKPQGIQLASGEIKDKAEGLPNKVSYAVFNAADEIVATTADRGFARELKAALGGKRKGIRIFSYVADKEIR